MPRYVRRPGSPLGPGGAWKTGQRCPKAGYWKDQYGQRAFIRQHSTFPPCLGRSGECAFWTFVSAPRPLFP